MTATLTAAYDVAAPLSIRAAASCAGKQRQHDRRNNQVFVDPLTPPAPDRRRDRCRQAARREQNDEEQRRRRKADDDGGQHERLWQRVGILRRIARCPVAISTGAPDPQPSHAEDEEIDRVREQRKADDDLERARPQHQPHSGSREHTNAEGED